MRRLPIAAASPLPPLYARWADDLLGGPLPQETEATCDDCAMLSEQREVGRGEYFDPVARCCTFQPELPNFLVGRILLDRDTPARASVEARIRDRLGVTPLGLAMPPTYDILYGRAAPVAFGQIPSLRCPHHLDDGRCGIWAHRNAICATWYCKHVRGRLAARFWREGIEVLLRLVEDDLARHCLATLDVEGDVVLAVLQTRTMARSGKIAPMDRVDPEGYRRVWGSWHGRERELFLESSKIVDALSWTDVLAICGPEVRLRAAVTRELYAKMQVRTLPPRLAVGTFEVVGATRDCVRVSSYSHFDPIEVPADLMPVLHRFDGRPTREALAVLKKKDGVELERDFVGQLVDFGILVEAHGD